MIQKRVGVIALIDPENKCGIILDENCQDISFELDDFSDALLIDTKVFFEIELNDNGLIAVNVIAID
ncbi:MAG: hypothetical protein EOO86_05705 [Pedobacter sp.]|nr:MAG: hypothetical protein EOO86_05705 [Pedobacter sp.]